MKILKEKYPKGSLKGQVSDGRYIEGYLYDNLKVMANAIVKDMTFLGFIFSSTLEVGTGKSVFATQLGEAWSYVMKEVHNIDIPFGLKNIVWRPKELIERAFQVPKYSFILLDEWEDAHYWSELGVSLRQFFRKCRQLNLFIVCIIPNFFQLGLGYAVSRSAFAIDVKFEEGFTRGYFSFYNFKEKTKLYLMGKKNYNYNVVKPSFNGRFTDGYGVPREEYLIAKRKDIEVIEDVSPAQKKKLLRELDIFERYLEKFPESTNDDLCKMFNKHVRTITKWKNSVKMEKLKASGRLEVIKDDTSDKDSIFVKEEPSNIDDSETKEKI